MFYTFIYIIQYSIHTSKKSQFSLFLLVKFILLIHIV